MTRECGTGSPPVAGLPLPCPVSWGEGAPAIASWSLYRDAEYADGGIRAAFHPFVPAAGEGREGGLVRLGVQQKRAVVQVVHAREALQQNRGKAKVGASGGSGSKVERQVVGASLRCPVLALCGDAGSQ